MSAAAKKAAEPRVDLDATRERLLQKKKIEET